MGEGKGLPGKGGEAGRSGGGSPVSLSVGQALGQVRTLGGGHERAQALPAHFTDGQIEAWESPERDESQSQGGSWACRLPARGFPPRRKSYLQLGEVQAISQAGRRSQLK